MILQSNNFLITKEQRRTREMKIALKFKCINNQFVLNVENNITINDLIKVLQEQLKTNSNMDRKNIF